MELNISERLFAINILNDFKGKLDKLALILEDVKQLPVTEEEWISAERVISDVGGGNMQWTWKDEKGLLKEVNLNKEVAKYIFDEIDRRSEAGEMKLTDKAAISLREKLVKTI